MHATEPQLGGHLGDGLRFGAQPEHLLLLGVQAHRDDVDLRLQHRLDAEVAPVRAGPSTRHDERAHEVVAAPGGDGVVHELSISCFSSITRSGVRTEPARSTRRVVW